MTGRARSPNPGVVVGYSGLHGSGEHHIRAFPDASDAEQRHYQGYDAAAAVFVDGHLVAAGQQERWSGRKFDHAFPDTALRQCLRLAGLSITDVDAVAHNFDHTGLRRMHDGNPRAADRYAGVLDPRLQQCWFAEHFGHVPPLTPVRHHLAHACYAVAAAGEDRLTVVVADGLGETDALSVFAYRDGRLDRIRSWPWRASLGLYYSLVTQHLGWLANSDEYKVMGLAAYGDPDRYRKVFDEAVVLRDDGGVDIAFLSLPGRPAERELHRPAGAWLTARLGPRRAREDPVEQHHADLAAAAQQRLEQALQHVITTAVARTGIGHVAFGGGVALNCLAVGRLAGHACDALLVPPAPGDDGTAIGAALALLDLDRARTAWPALPLLGPPPTATSLLARRPDHLACVTDPRIRSRMVAQVLAAGAVVGWAHGPMEFGPRALGNRSIFADPRTVASRERVNRAVKQREPFRPLAPAVKAGAARRYFDLPPAQLRHMTAVAHARPAAVQEVPAVVHADNTSRVQVVHRSEHPVLWQLLDAFEALTGVPVLLNTSLNVNGRPMACTAEDALATYDTGTLDVLVVDGHVLATDSWRSRVLDALRRATAEPNAPARGSRTEA
ncbi:carbamoyltransferase family protein [Streptomyces echinatus]|uniref:Carbamoyltransferase n=1 Tax=Streptomyces echinatus TaxID=67293 RepID=A0A7W9UQJ6_9ACTN|nr:carbamoyltransferase C-terminal domain-containing protein [Streptomyces echinatus]MBB5926579.1 carbamoyltransferase [Streptomyces echinatus]